MRIIYNDKKSSFKELLETDKSVLINYNNKAHMIQKTLVKEKIALNLK